MYNYFVSYSVIRYPNIHCFGNCEVKRDEKILSSNDIIALESALEEKMNLTENSLKILNFILFEKN